MLRYVVEFIKTLPQRLSECLGCKDCYANTNGLTYLLTYLLAVISLVVVALCKQ